MDAGLVGHWKFNEKSGIIANDSSRYRNTGTLTGATHLPVWSDKGIKFDGVDDYVDAGNAASLNITSAITIGVWVNLNISVTSRVCYKSNLINNGFTVDNVNGIFRYQTYIDGAFRSSSTSVTISNVWTYMVVTYNSSEPILKTYKNGVLVGSIVLSGLTSYDMTPAPASNFMIGRNTSEFLKGSIDEVHIFNRALNASEIKRHYNSTKHNYI